MDRDSIVQSCRRRLHLDRTIRNDFWDIPVTFLGPVNAEHMVRHSSTKDQLLVLIRLGLTDFNLIYRDVSGLNLNHKLARSNKNLIIRRLTLNVSMTYGLALREVCNYILAACINLD